MAKVDGSIVRIGDIVSFKSDIEQCGKIIKINGDILVLESTRPEGFSGDYIGGSDRTQEYCWDCWIE